MGRGAFALIERRRRCIVPIDGFFEWQAIRGSKANGAGREPRTAWPPSARPCPPDRGAHVAVRLLLGLGLLERGELAVGQDETVLRDLRLQRLEAVPARP
jgi:hypothetical protein